MILILFSIIIDPLIDFIHMPNADIRELDLDALGKLDIGDVLDINTLTKWKSDKILIIDKLNHGVRKDLYLSLPLERRARDKRDTGIIAFIRCDTNDIPFYYTDGSPARREKCSIIVIDAQTRKAVAAKGFRGDSPTSIVWYRRVLGHDWEISSGSPIGYVPKDCIIKYLLSVEPHPNEHDMIDCLNVSDELNLEATIYTNSLPKSDDTKSNAVSKEEVFEGAELPFLMSVAKTGCDPLVRKKAIGMLRLIDQNTLEQIFDTDPDISVRLLALERLTDQSILLGIYKMGLDEYMRKKVVERLTNQDILTYIFKKEQVESVRRVVVDRLTDQSILSRIAKTDMSAVVRRSAVRRVMDQLSIVDIARTDPDFSVRKEAIERLSNQSDIEELARTDSDPSVRKIAVERLANQSVIEEIARTDSDPSVRRKAATKLMHIDR
jgi:hypothetical protein